MDEELPGQISIEDALGGARRFSVVQPAGGRTSLSLEQQLKIHDRLVDKAYSLMIDFVIEREDELKEGSRARLEAYYDEYGDAAFQKLEEENVVGALEEGDDLLNYLIFALYKRGY
jgi:hypothetical protein